MLVLRRRRGERFRIGDDIVITVMEVGRGEVRLGIEVPREVPVYRDDGPPAGQGRTGDENKRG